MELLKIPTKYKLVRSGISIKCLFCKWELGSGKCHEDKDKVQNISKCEHKDRHRYSLLVCVPNGNKARRTRIVETRDFEEALQEMKQFREELKAQGYHKVKRKTEIIKPTFMNYAADYIDCLSGENTPLHLIRVRSKGHISDTKRAILMFGKVLKKAGYNIEMLKLDEIGDDHVELFYKHLNYELKLSTTTYNRYMVIMKTFFNWCIDVKDFAGKNPFSKAELSFERQEKNIVSKSEFDKLLETVTYENGFAPKHGETRNYYRPWLVNAYRLALETGERAEPLVRLKWNDIIEVEGNIEMFRISNLKANRIRTGQDKGKYVRYIPVTRSLKALLVELGYNTKKGTDECVLKTEAGESSAYIMQLITRSFSHYVAKAGLRHILFKDLRKTYVSHLTVAMGANAKMYTGHADSRVMEHHYLSQSFLSSKLKEFDVL